jgi:O-antigen ligase
MMLGFLVSRALLSGAVFLFGINALWNVPPRAWLKQKWWLVGVAWVALFALSYLWSDDKAYWGQRLEVKLPVLLLPLAFSQLPAFSLKQLKIFTIVTALLLLAGAAYSASFVVNNVDYYINQYQTSHVLPVPAEGDHIRFSMCIALFIIWCVYLWPRFDSTILKWFIGMAIVLLAAYLHLLAARTGLAMLYVFIVLWAIYYGWKKSKLAGLSIILLLFLLGYVAVHYVPTLENRIGYFSYTYILYQKGEMSAIYGDMNRLISYDIAGTLIRSHPLTGVGAGDMLHEMAKGYAVQHPGAPPEQVILPHNEFLIIMLGAGLPALLLFVVWIFAPLRAVKKNREGFFFLTVWLVLLLPLLVEPLLEIQYGLFVYLFFLLWQWHALTTRRAVDTA